MSKQIEALKLALEGLEKWHFDKDPRGAADYIAAIHDALAEQPAPPPECKTYAEKTAFAFGWWKALEENRKQPAQDKEPCGWRMKHNGEWAYSFTKDAWDFIYAVSPAARKAARDNAPASKPWVGLTDEDVTWLCNTAKSHEQTWGMFVRAIEAKLREKNA